MRFLGENKGSIVFVNGGTARTPRVCDLHTKRNKMRVEVATG